MPRHAQNFSVSFIAGLGSILSYLAGDNENSTFLFGISLACIANGLYDLKEEGRLSLAVAPLVDEWHSFWKTVSENEKAKTFQASTELSPSEIWNILN